MELIDLLPVTLAAAAIGLRVYLMSTGWVPDHAPQEHTTAELAA